MARQNKRFFAIIRGHYAPALVTSWAIACALTDDYKGNQHKGFKSLKEAKAYMEENNITKYQTFGNPGELKAGTAVGDRFYYAVANGRGKGIYEYFEIEAKEKVDKYPHACHKRFRTLEGAQAFVAEYKEAKRCLNQQEMLQNDSLEDMMRRLRLN